MAAHACVWCRVGRWFVPSRREIWGGFHGTPLITSRHVRLNVQRGNIGSICRSSTVCLVVNAHIVPDTAMSTAALLGRDSWSYFPVRQYRDVSKTETVGTFLENENAQPVDQHFNQWVNGAVGMIESKRKKRRLVRDASHNQSFPNGISLVQVHLTSIDGTDAAEGLYYIRFGSDWFPQEAIVETGISQISLQRLNADGPVVQRGMRFGVGGDRLEPCKTGNAEITQNELPCVNAVVGGGRPEKSDDEPPTTVLSTLNALQQKTFLRL